MDVIRNLVFIIWYLRMSVVNIRKLHEHLEKQRSQKNNRNPGIKGYLKKSPYITKGNSIEKRNQSWQGKLYHKIADRKRTRKAPQLQGIKKQEGVHVPVNPEGDKGEGDINSRLSQKKNERIRETPERTERTKTRTQQTRLLSLDIVYRKLRIICNLEFTQKHQIFYKNLCKSVQSVVCNLNLRIRIYS